MEYVAPNVVTGGEALTDVLSNSRAPLICAAPEPWMWMESRGVKARAVRITESTDLEAVDGSLYCCGMAGIMGFKRDFHETSIHLGRRLMDKIKDLDPRWLVTDCLSCRLQFNQLLPYKVQHPVEILKEAYVG